MPFPNSRRDSFGNNFIDYLKNSKILAKEIIKFHKDSDNLKDLLKNTGPLSRIFNGLPISYQFTSSFKVEEKATATNYCVFDQDIEAQLFALYEKLVVDEIDENNHEIPVFLHPDIEYFLRRAVTQAARDLLDQNGQLKQDIANFIGILNALPNPVTQVYISKIIYPVMHSYISQIITANMIPMYHAKYSDNQRMMDKSHVIPGKITRFLDKTDPETKSKTISDFFNREIAISILNQSIFTQGNFCRFLNQLAPKLLTDMVTFDINKMDERLEHALHDNLYEKRSDFWLGLMVWFLKEKDYERLLAIYYGLPTSLKNSWNERDDSVDLSDFEILLAISIKEILGVVRDRQEEKPEDRKQQEPSDRQLIVPWFNARDNQFFLDSIIDVSADSRFVDYLQWLRQDEWLMREPTEKFITLLFADEYLIQNFKKEVFVSLTRLKMDNVKSAIILVYAEGDETPVRHYLNNGELDGALAILLTKKNDIGVSDEDKIAISQYRHQLAERTVYFLKSNVRDLAVGEQNLILQQTINGDNLLGKVLNTPCNSLLFGVSYYMEYMFWGSTKTTTSIQMLQDHLERCNSM